MLERVLIEGRPIDLGQGSIGILGTILVFNRSRRPDRATCSRLVERRPIQAIDGAQATSGGRQIGIPGWNKSESVDHLIRLPLRPDIQYLDPMLNRTDIWIAAMGAS